MCECQWTVVDFYGFCRRTARTVTVPRGNPKSSSVEFASSRQEQCPCHKVGHAQLDNLTSLSHQQLHRFEQGKSGLGIGIRIKNQERRRCRFRWWPTYAELRSCLSPKTSSVLSPLLLYSFSAVEFVEAEKREEAATRSPRSVDENR